MYTARIENAQGESLQLSQREDLWQITDIDGLGPVSATVHMTDLAGLDGARFNSANLTTRNIVITLVLRGDVEANRQRIYRFCRTKELCTVFFENNYRSVYAAGYVDNVDVDLFQRSEKIQISIICPDPYFYASASSSSAITHSHPLFEFPFAIDDDEPVEFSSYAEGEGARVLNSSETSTGIIVKLSFTAAASNVTIENVTTGEHITLAYEFLAGDIVTINTNPGQKAIRLKRGDADTNIFSAMDILESSFIQLASGQNIINITVDGEGGEGVVSATLSYSEKYRGV